MRLRLERGQTLLDGALSDAAITVDSEQGIIVGIDEQAGSQSFDASGLLVLPGIVDVHGDAFERQLMPRPAVNIDIDIALLESDRQAISNGITTIFHGVTWSWEPGLRDAENARKMLASIESLRPKLAADTRFHLRHETFNLDAESEIVDWIVNGRVDVLAFNDHMSLADEDLARPEKFAQMVQRSGLPRDRFVEVVGRVKSRASDVPSSIERIAAVANANGIPLLSHDDGSPEQRRWFRNLGCRLSEFPTTLETAQEAAGASDDIVLGAPNVVRGGSHVGWVNAADMVEQGLCSILASDYYYPAPLLAGFRLAASGAVSLGQAWSLVSGAPARAVGLSGRGRIATGCRGDLIAVDATHPLRPRVVAAITAGRIAYLTDARRMSCS